MSTNFIFLSRSLPLSPEKPSAATPPLIEVKWKSLSCVRLFATHRLHSPWNSPSQNTEMGSLSLLQGIFPTQGSILGLPHRRRILYQLSHEGSPRILEWVAYPFSSTSSSPRTQTGISCIAGRFFTNWAIREASLVLKEAYYHLVSLSLFPRSASQVLPGSPLVFGVEMRTEKKEQQGTWTWEMVPNRHSMLAWSFQTIFTKIGLLTETRS